MTTTNIIHLRPNRSLIDPNFDGYKLSLDPVPVKKLSLPATPRRCHTNEDQYSFLHAKLFSTHNLLVNDPWYAYSFYYLDTNWTIQNVKYNADCGKLDAIRAVFKLPKPNESNADYNPTFCFVSEKYCVLGDGCGTLRIIDTGDRQRGEEWKGNFVDSVLIDNNPFCVQDARLDFRDGIREINCLLLSVQCKPVVDGDRRFEAVLDWLTFHKIDANANWTIAASRQLRGSSIPEYCVLEPKARAILLSTDRKWEFLSDSVNPIVPKKSDENGGESVAAGNDDSSINFTWTQTDEDVIIHFNISRDCNKNDIKVVCNGPKIQVQHRNISLLDAELFDRIDHDLTTWNLENELLQVTLVKAVTERVWTSLLNNIDIAPSEYPMQPIRDLAQPPTSTLHTEMEDCDYGDGDLDSEYFLDRIDVVNHQITHRVTLGQNNPSLFTLLLRPAHPPALVIRNDVDACVWLPLLSAVPTAADTAINWQLQHEGTINALGYVQASKQLKKYIRCSADMSYAIIAEPNRHIFIYKTGHSGASGLKHRGSGTRISVGKQHLVTMEENDEIVGIYAEDQATILLTQNYIIVLQVNA